RPTRMAPTRRKCKTQRKKVDAAPGRGGSPASTLPALKAMPDSTPLKLRSTEDCKRLTITVGRMRTGTSTRPIQLKIRPSRSMSPSRASLSEALDQREHHDRQHDQQ